MNKNDWLTFRLGDDEMPKDWNASTSDLLKKALGEDADVHVELQLPKHEDAACSWRGNFNLVGKIKFQGTVKGAADIALPFDGVFLARSFGAIHPNRLVWDNCLVEKLGVRLIRPTSIIHRNSIRFRIGLPSGNHFDIPLRMKRSGEAFNDKVRRFGRLVQELRLASEVYRSAYPEWIWTTLFSELLLKTDGKKSYKDSDAKKVIAEAFNELFDTILTHYKVIVGKDKHGKVISEYEHLKNHKDTYDQDDLAHRVVWSFPRWLQHRLCKRFFFRRDDIRKGNVALSDLLYGLVPLTGKGILDKTAGDLVYVMPENPVDLAARIHGIKRFPVSRESSADFPAEYRQNHPSFEKRICPLESPESELVGIALQLARGARVDRDGVIVEAVPDVLKDGVTAEGCQPFVSWGASMIPFLHHNDGARNMMGAKNLRQALLVAGREAPMVKTGGEASLVKQMGRLMDVGICPDCRGMKGAIDEGELALGCDLLVAYMPWYGWNVDDAIVVSKSICERMAVKKEKVLSRLLKPGWRVLGEEQWRMDVNDGMKHLSKTLRAGDAIVELKGPNGESQTLRYADFSEAEVALQLSPESQSGVLPEGAQPFRRLKYVLRRTLNLGVGDKLMGRHGNKGVVAKILDEQDMPYVKLPDGSERHVEVLLNPHGVLSRMNPGQLLETHLGWLLKNNCKAEDFCRYDCKLGYPIVGGVVHDAVRKSLVASGLNQNGAVALHWRQGDEEIESKNPIVIGYQYFLRLNHIPELKAQARRGGVHAKYSLDSCQAAQGRKAGGGQRAGEMEMWGLRAYMADAVIDEMLGEKSNAVLVKNPRDPLACLWSEKLDALPGVPHDVLSTGFGLYLRDWLRAMLIDVKYDDQRRSLVFKRLCCDCDGEQGPNWDFDSNSISSGRPKLSQSVSFGCYKGCQDGFPLNRSFGGITRGSQKNTYLTVACLLAEFGLSCQGRLKEVESKDGRRVFRQEVASGENSQVVGELVLTCLIKKMENTNLVFAVSVKDLELGEANHGLADFFCVMNDKYKEKKESEKKNERFSCGEMIDELCGENGKLSLADCRISCPQHQKSALRLPNEGLETTDLGLQSNEIFGAGEKVWECVGNEGWGHIKLPVPISGRRLIRGILGKKIVDETFPDFDIQYIPVLPKRYRMEAISDSLGGDACSSTLNSDGYFPVLNQCEQYAKANNDSEREKCKRNIYEAALRLFKLLHKRLVDKMGLIRHEGLGRRVDRTFRLVIVPDPTLKIDECGVPADVLLEVLDRERSFRGRIALRKNRMNLSHTDTIGWSWWAGGSGCPETVDSVRTRLQEIFALNPDVRIILNRQPSLHRDSILAFKPKPIYPDGDGGRFPAVLKLPPLCCKCFAADFDGDEMVGHATGELTGAAQESLVGMSLRGNILSIDNFDWRDGSKMLTLNLDRDLVSGLALWKRDSKDHAKWAVKSVQEQTIIEQCEEKAFDIDEVVTAAWEACTKDGCSFGFYDLLDCTKSPFVDGTVVDNDRLDKDAEEQVKSCSNPALRTMVGTDANGKSQIRHYLIARGELKPGKLGYDAIASNPTGMQTTQRDCFFRCTLTEGMKWDEIFWSSLNARSSMCDKKLGTALSGDLTRKLVFALQHIKVVKDRCECDEKDRSVLNCKCTDGVCAACYGKLPDGLYPENGFPIGLIAALAIGERGTQLSMKSAHTGGGKNDFESVRSLIFRGSYMKEDDGKKERISNESWDWQAFYANILDLSMDYEKVSRRHFEVLWRRLEELSGRCLLDKDGKFQACRSGLDALAFGLSEQKGHLERFWKANPDGIGVSLPLDESQCARIMFGNKCSS